MQGQTGSRRIGSSAASRLFLNMFSCHVWFLLSGLIGCTGNSTGTKTSRCSVLVTLSGNAVETIIQLFLFMGFLCWVKVGRCTPQFTFVQLLFPFLQT